MLGFMAYSLCTHDGVYCSEDVTKQRDELESGLTLVVSTNYSVALNTFILHLMRTQVSLQPSGASTY